MSDRPGPRFLARDDEHLADGSTFDGLVRRGNVVQREPDNRQLRQRPGRQGGGDVTGGLLERGYGNAVQQHEPEQHVGRHAGPDRQARVGRLGSVRDNLPERRDHGQVKLQVRAEGHFGTRTPRPAALPGSSTARLRSRNPSIADVEPTLDYFPLALPGGGGNPLGGYEL